MSYERAVIEFGQGLNDKDNAFDIQDTQSPDMLNIMFEGNETIRTRDGYAQYASTVSGSDYCVGLGKYSYSSGTGTTTNSIYSVFGTDIYKNVSGTWTSQSLTLTDNTDGNFVQANNELYYFNGTDAVSNLSNTTWSTLSSGTPMSGSNNIGRYAVFYSGMLFVAGTNAYPNRVYVSGDTDGSLDTPEDFSGGWAYDIGTNDGSGEITGLIVLNNSVVVLKQRAIYALIGETGDTLSIDAKVEGIGCVAPKSIATDGDFVFFQSANRHIYAFDGAKAWNISEVITGTIESLESTETDQSVGAYDSNRDYYIIACVDDGDTTTSIGLVFDINRSVVQTFDYNARVWMKFDNITANNFIEYTSSNGDVVDLIFGDSGGTGKTFTMFSGTNDDDVAINAYYTTKNFSFGERQREKRSKYLFIDAFQSGAWNLDISYSVNQADFAFTIPSSLDLTPTGFILPETIPAILGEAILVENNMVTVPANWRFISFKLSNSTADQFFKVYSMTLMYRYARQPLKLSAI